MIKWAGNSSRQLIVGQRKMKELSSRHEEITGQEEEIFDTKIGEGEKEQLGGEQSSVGTKPIDWGQGGGEGTENR